MVEKTKCGDLDAVVVEIKGKAYYLGTATYTTESDDPLGKGFLLH